ncbi:hypothetical protein F4821DRAFT_241495 [Hypoxylon rubiginosum]|uniref:Uncharacterized protein n=1 Tax=Hypoxylon rubiginosum TaxID=110542 RepID=A0ACC0CXQ5_9PEZI|nr:hypothetical protein F4821DRAFT_241495 [Hypoxylon rubiginosum]
MPTLHGTTSHIDSPHPTQVPGDQVDQVITETTVGQKRRLSVTSPKMLFSDLYKSKKSPLLRWRQHHSNPAPAATDYDPDLVSRDKTKQKEAIKRFLAEKVRNDWHFEWSRPTEKSDSAGAGSRAPVKTQEDDDLVAEGTDSDNDAPSVYSTVSEDLAHFRPRKEWLSDMPDDSEADDPPDSPSAYRFDTPDAVGTTVKSVALAKSAKRRKALRDEMEWNDGLACFNARRDAWTGAKAARVRPKPVSQTPTSPTAKRLSFWGHLGSSPPPMSPTEPVSVTSPLSPSGTRTSGDTTVVASSDAEFREAKSKEDTSTFPVETLIPLSRPLLPPTTPMRASITPAAYITIYDKIVLQSATPSCPINLNDVVRSCVTGWKRDGEWPPRSTEPPPVVAVRKKKKDGAESRAHATRRMSFNFLGRKQSAGNNDNGNLAANTSHAEREDAGHGSKAFKKGLQRVLGLGHERAPSNTSSQGMVIGNKF